jgi:nodulation protein E
MRRVVITGMGCIAASGHTADACWAAMRDGKSGIGPVVNMATEMLNVRIAAEVRGYDPLAHFDEKRLALLDRVTQFALIAAREAIAQSGLAFRQDGLGERTAVIIGSGVGGQNTLDDSYKRLYLERNTRCHPLTIPRLMINAPASHITMEFGITGPAFVVGSACSSANHAMAQALHMIRSGLVDAAVTGGTEACLTVGTMKGWEAMRVMAFDTCRPFSRDRRGMVLGEGAGVYVLETLENARARGATILAELAGAGMSSDAGDIVAPSEQGAGRAMTAALADGGMTLDEVDYINAHGTGTPINDSTETRTIRRVFGALADRLWISSTKAVHGHGLGAAGALELVAVIGAIKHGIVPPTLNYNEPDPDCNLDYVPNTARERAVRGALTNSFAFGGLNAVLALRRVD